MTSNAATRCAPEHHPLEPRKLLRLAAINFTLCFIGLSSWAWIVSHRLDLPSPQTETGENLLDLYLMIAHNIWLILLSIAIIILIQKIISTRVKTKTTHTHINEHLAKRLIKFTKNNPIFIVIIIIYSVAMIQGTTYLYRDMIGWYPELIGGNFLDNFSIRESFVNETMRRSDYRFFPLAHQDLHILSWFTLHIKVWMLVSAAELICIVLYTAKLVQRLEHQFDKPDPSLLVVITLLLLHHPATGTTFFHVIYSERLLCLIFILYLNFYVVYQQHKTQSCFYLTILMGLLGIYVKDIAILLFTIPPCLTILSGIFVDTRNKKLIPSERIKYWSQTYSLELWLGGLSLIFGTSYIYLSLLPSTYANTGAYNNDSINVFYPDGRFWLLLIICLTRMFMIQRSRATFSLLDRLNLTAIIYASALGASYRFEASSYLSLPIQLIIVVNIGCLWQEFTTRIGHRHWSRPWVSILGMLSSLLFIGIEHKLSKNSFLKTVTAIKLEQNSIQKTFEKLNLITRTIREDGDDVNIIINERSRFTAKRHLRRIPYTRLIEYKPDSKQFIIKDGAGKGDIYQPKTGDIVANLDKKVYLIEPVIKATDFEIIYRHNSSVQSGMIVRINSFIH